MSETLPKINVSNVKNNMNPKCIDLKTSPLGRYPWLIPILEKILYISTVNKMIERSSSDATIPEKLIHVFKYLNINLCFHQEDLSLIPKSGPLVVIANHPFGGIEGLALAHLLFQVRADVKILANYLLKYIEPIEPIFLGIDSISKKNQRQNICGLRQAQKWLKANGVLGIFPSGTVSHWHWKQLKVSDPIWHETAARLINNNQATALPIFFHGRNSWFFQCAGIISPFFRTLLLPQQFIAKENSDLRISIGKPICYSDLTRHNNLAKQTLYLREQTYSLGDN